MGILALPPSGIITDSDGIVIGRASDGKGYLLTGGTEGQVPVVQGDGTIAYGAAGASSLSELDDWAANTLTVPGALTVQQAGGVAGTDEIQISHDGSNGLIASQSGNLTLRSDFGDLILQPDGSAQGDIYLKQDTHVLKTASNAVASFVIESELGNCLLKMDSYHASNDTAIIAFHGANSSQSNQAIYVRGDTGDLSFRENNYSNIWLFKEYGVNEVCVRSSLIIRQPGGVAGTDEIQIYHDGTDAYIQSQSDGGSNLWISGPVATNAGIQIYSNGTAGQINYYTRGVHRFYEDSIEAVSISRTNFYSGTTVDFALGLVGSANRGIAYLCLDELSSDPSDPSEGQSVLWQSDGTGSGDDGDIMVKITAGGVTKTATLIDFSAV